MLTTGSDYKKVVSSKMGVLWGLLKHLTTSKLKYGTTSVLPYTLPFHDPMTDNRQAMHVQLEHMLTLLWP
jgi:hypothetical protein